MRRTPLVATLLLLWPLIGGEARLRDYETRHFLVRTDLPPEQVRIVCIRIDKLAEEYRRRLSDFGIVDPARLPFYLYSNAEDYYATGAPRDSAGRYTGTALLAAAEGLGPKTWHIIQHEAFHQFADHVFGARLPRWLNEGLAEYFGEAIFTGDGYVTGVIPQWRLERIRGRFQSGEFVTLTQLMSMPAETWDLNLSLAKYDQCWSLVHYLAHGEGGSHRQQFNRFLKELSRGQRQDRAWERALGDADELERRWREYWLNLPDGPTLDVYAEATVAVLSSFLARAQSRGQVFESFESFEQAASMQRIECHPDDWLPASLLTDALQTRNRLSADGAKFSLEAARDSTFAQVQCVLKDGTRLRGHFTIRDGRVCSVVVERSGS